MTSKTKVIISVTTLCLVALIAVIAVVAVFASNVQNFKSKVVVNFVSEHVKGTAAARYYVGEEDSAGRDMLSSFGGTKLEFDPDKEVPETELMLAPLQEINLSLEDKFVVFEYIFTNEGENSYIANIQFSGEAKNVTVNFNNKGEKIENFETILTSFETLDGNNFSTEIKVEPNGQPVYVYFKVSISIPADSSSFIGNFNWSLVGQ